MIRNPATGNRFNMTPMEIDFGRPTERVIGIDLGTTNSLVAYMDVTAPKVIPGEDGDRLVEVPLGDRARAPDRLLCRRRP